MVKYCGDKGKYELMIWISGKKRRKMKEGEKPLQN